MNQWLIYAGWKKLNGKWNKDEIIVDLIVIVAALIIVGFGVRYA